MIAVLALGLMGFVAAWMGSGQSSCPSCTVSIAVEWRAFHTTADDKHDDAVLAGLVELEACLEVSQ